MDDRQFDQELSNRAIKSSLKKLDKKQLLSLLRDWYRDDRVPIPLDCKSEIESLIEMDQEGLNVTLTKANLANKIYKEFYRSEFNLLQVAQIESLHVISSSSSMHLWNESKMLENGRPINILENGQIENESFLKAFVYEMGIAYKCHIYMNSYKDLQMTLLRVVPFETSAKIYNSDEYHSKSAPLTTGYSPRKPIYVAFPFSSPSIIHTDRHPQLDAVLHAIGTVLSKPGKMVTVARNKSSVPESLMSLLKLKGVNRHASMQGRYQMYAENAVDNAPLNMLHDRPSYPMPITSLAHNQNAHDVSIKDLNIRFAGREEVEANYKSAVPLTLFEVKIIEPMKDYPDETPAITLRFSGDDVFAGIRELAIDQVLDSDYLPDYLTGEEGCTSGVVRKGAFVQS